MKLLIVDNNDSFTYNLVQLVEETGMCSFDVVPAHEVDIEAAACYDKILFSPGPGVPGEFPAMWLLLDRYKQTKSFLGVCLGHQAIAQYFGASLINLPEVVHGQQKKLMLATDDELFKGVDNNLQVGLYHSWLVDSGTIPEELVVTAHTAEGRVMALCHRQLDIRGVQFHPESIMTPQGAPMIKNWLQL